jgi:hypothetical protein
MAKGLRAKSEKRKRSEKRKKMDAHDTLRNERLAKKMEDELASNIIQMETETHGMKPLVPLKDEKMKESPAKVALVTEMEVEPIGKVDLSKAKGGGVQKKKVVRGRDQKKKRL